MLELVIFLALLPAAIGTVLAILWMLFIAVTAVCYGIGWLISLPLSIAGAVWRAIKA